MSISAGMEWLEKTFTAFPHCFFQLCRTEPQLNDATPIHRTCCININGDVLLLCDSGETVTERRLYLRDYLPQSSSDASTRSMLSSMNLSGNLSGSKRSLTQSLSGGSSGGSFHPKMTQLEIVAIDAIEENRDRVPPGKILVLTCWGETCELGTTSKYQLVLFRIEMHTGKASVLAKEFISRPVALVRFISYRSTKRGSIGALVFPSNEKAAIYHLVPDEDGSFSLVLTSDISKEYPELSEALPGTAVKMATQTIGKFRWTLVGCDNGHLRFWRTTLRTNKVLLVKRMRFFGAVSVTDIYQPYKNEDDEEEEEDEPTVHVIVSSTLGPVAIYRIVQYRNHDTVSWDQRAILGMSRKEDTVTCAARKGDYLCVGYFSQHMYTYNLKLILDLPPSEIVLPYLSDAKVNAPTAAIQFVDQFEISLITFAGHHSLMSIEDEGEEEETELSEEAFEY